MKTITLLPERDYKIVGGELNVFKTTPVKVEEETYTNRQVLIASTANIEGVKQLDRKAFVKKEDVKMLAHIHALNTYVYPKNKDGERITIPAGQSTPPNLTKHCKKVEPHFIAGYNANKGEFSREEMIEFAQMVKHSSFDLTYEDMFDKLRPLSLPTSIIVDESYNIKKVNW